MMDSKWNDFLSSSVLALSVGDETPPKQSMGNTWGNFGQISSISPPNQSKIDNWKGSHAKSIITSVSFLQKDINLADKKNYSISKNRENGSHEKENIAKCVNFSSQWKAGEISTDKLDFDHQSREDKTRALSLGNQGEFSADVPLITNPSNITRKESRSHSVPTLFESYDESKKENVGGVAEKTNPAIMTWNSNPGNTKSFGSTTTPITPKPSSTAQSNICTLNNDSSIGSNVSLNLYSIQSNIPNRMAGMPMSSINNPQFYPPSAPNYHVPYTYPEGVQYPNAVYKGSTYPGERSSRPRAASALDVYSESFMEMDNMYVEMYSSQARRLRSNSEIVQRRNYMISPRAFPQHPLTTFHSPHGVPGTSFVETMPRAPTEMLPKGMCYRESYGLEILPKGEEWYYEIEFKLYRRDLFIGQANYSVGDYVKVEADRGQDLGHIVRVAPDINALRGLLNGDGVTDKRLMMPMKKLIRLATDSELTYLAIKFEEEAEVLSVCRTKVLERMLPMQVIDAEYQFDRHKLTFYFEAERRIDFRELVRDLFSMYKTRIWLQQVTPDAGKKLE